MYKADKIRIFSKKLNKWIEYLCAALMATLVLIVWSGVISRYGLHLGLSWTEELARYVMIWAALLAIPIGVYRGEHIGVSFLVARLSPMAATILLYLLDILGLAFFVFLAFYGIKMTLSGFNQYAMIFGMPMAFPYASVPVSSTLAALQMALHLWMRWNGAGSAGRKTPLEKAEIGL